MKPTLFLRVLYIIRGKSLIKKGNHFLRMLLSIYVQTPPKEIKISISSLRPLCSSGLIGNIYFGENRLNWWKVGQTHGQADGLIKQRVRGSNLLRGFKSADF